MPSKQVHQEMTRIVLENLGPYGELFKSLERQLIKYSTDPNQEHDFTYVHVKTCMCDSKEVDAEICDRVDKI